VQGFVHRVPLGNRLMSSLNESGSGTEHRFFASDPISIIVLTFPMFVVFLLFQMHTEHFLN
jgi:hypothetical protein